VAVTARTWVAGELNTAAKMNTIRDDLLELESLMQQIRTFFKQTVSVTTGWGANQDFTLATTLADYTKADVVRCYVESSGAFFAGGAAIGDLNAYLTSNTNLRVRGPSGPGTTSVVVVIEEKQNLAA
jgi:hypothetical protein